MNLNHFEVPRKAKPVNALRGRLGCDLTRPFNHSTCPVVTHLQNQGMMHHLPGGEVALHNSKEKHLHQRYTGNRVQHLGRIIYSIFKHTYAHAFEKLQPGFKMSLLRLLISSFSSFIQLQLLWIIFSVPSHSVF